MSYENFIPWGWNDFLESFFELHLQEYPDHECGRVVNEERGLYQILLPARQKSYAAQVSGSLRFSARGREDFPAVGDWICVDSVSGNDDRARIVAVLPRRSCLMRKAAGTSAEVQIFASQVDEALVVTSCNFDLNEKRIDRALALISSSGASPRIVLTKVDLIDAAELSKIVQGLEGRFPGVPISTLSARTGYGMEEFRATLRPAATYVVLGSSGVGKSTLLNSLLGGEVLPTQAIREDDQKGRHTTVSRSLHAVASGALVIDTPGIRELQLLDDEEALDRNFDDIAALKLRCRFSNCHHETEPGCEIRRALDTGELAMERWESYLKLQREMEFQNRKYDKALQSEKKAEWIQISKKIRAKSKINRKY